MPGIHFAEVRARVTLADVLGVLVGPGRSGGRGAYRRGNCRYRRNRHQSVDRPRVRPARGTHRMGLGLEEMLQGADPMEPETVWERLYRGSKMTGRRVP